MNKYHINVNGIEYAVTLLSKNGSALSFEVDGKTYSSVISQPSKEYSLTNRNTVPAMPAHTPKTTASQKSSNPGEIAAPIPGIVSALKVSVGQSVNIGDTVALIEAMKMENPIRSASAGRVEEIFCSAGDEVRAGQIMLRLT